MGNRGFSQLMFMYFAAAAGAIVFSALAEAQTYEAQTYKVWITKETSSKPGRTFIEDEDGFIAEYVYNSVTDSYTPKYLNPSIQNSPTTEQLKKESTFVGTSPSLRVADVDKVKIQKINLDSQKISSDAEALQNLREQKGALEAQLRAPDQAAKADLQKERETLLAKLTDRERRLNSPDPNVRQQAREEQRNSSLEAVHGGATNTGRNGAQDRKVVVIPSEIAAKLTGPEAPKDPNAATLAAAGSAPSPTSAAATPKPPELTGEQIAEALKKGMKTPPAGAAASGTDSTTTPATSIVDAVNQATEKEKKAKTDYLNWKSHEGEIKDFEKLDTLTEDSVKKALPKDVAGQLTPEKLAEAKSILVQEKASSLGLTASNGKELSKAYQEELTAKDPTKKTSNAQTLLASDWDKFKEDNKATLNQADITAGTELEKGMQESGVGNKLRVADVGTYSEAKKATDDPDYALRHHDTLNSRYNEDRYMRKGEEGCEYSSTVGHGGCETTRDDIKNYQAISQIGQTVGGAIVGAKSQYEVQKAYSAQSMKANLEAGASSARWAGGAQVAQGVLSLGMALGLEARVSKHEDQQENFDRVSKGDGWDTKIKIGNGTKQDVSSKEIDNLQNYTALVIKHGGDSGTGQRNTDAGYVSIEKTDAITGQYASEFEKKFKMNAEKHKIVHNVSGIDPKNLAVSGAMTSQGQQIAHRHQNLLDKEADIKETIQDYSSNAAAEQQEVADEASGEKLLHYAMATKSAIEAYFSYNYAKDLEKAADKLKKDKYTPNFSNDPMQIGTGDAPTSGTTITGLDQGIEGSLENQAAGPIGAGKNFLGPEIPDEGKGGFDGAPAAAPFVLSGDNGGGGGNSPLGSTGGTNDLSASAPEEGKPVLAGTNPYPGYTGGGGGYQGGGGGGRGRNGGGSSGGLGDLLAKLLPKSEENYNSGNRTMDLTGNRQPAAAGSEILGKKANLFARVTAKYREKTESNAVGF